MTPSNVYALPGCTPSTGEPDANLVKLLRELLASAEAGSLQEFVAVGCDADGAITTAINLPTLAVNIPLVGALTYMQHTLMQMSDDEG